MRGLTETDFEAFRALANSVRVRAASTANLTIATALNGGDSLDGVTLADGDLVLVKDQTAPAENGVYIVSTVPVRHIDFSDRERNATAAYDRHPGTLVTALEGTSNADTVWLCKSNKGGALGTTALTFTQQYPAASDTTPGLIEIATQAEQETGTDTTRAVTPGRQHFHPSAAKAWCSLNTSGGLGQSYNITSVTDNGTGSWSVNIATDFSDQFWAGFAFGGYVSGVSAVIYNCQATAAGTFQILAFNPASTLTDPTSDNIFFVGFGDRP